MTARQKSGNYEDKWVDDYMAAERRRNAAIGAAILVAVVMMTMAILYYFGSLAATGW